VERPAGDVPVNIEGTPWDPEMWRYLRQGGAGQSKVPDKKAATLIQSSGQEWREFRVELLTRYGKWMLAGVFAVLALLFMTRGRIRIEAGFSEKPILRFGSLERFAHWLLALSFFVLALTGLNILYGGDVVMPLIGHSRFAKVAAVGKWLHDFTGFSFIAGLILILVLWVRDNLPDRTDFIWLRQGGGLLPKQEHPPAKRFNAGQKIIFWFVLLAGGSVSVSGICLILPFTFAPFSGTFAALNYFGADFPTDLSSVQEMRLTLSWHGGLSIIMIAVVIAHVYVGTVGMEGAFDAMATGDVDENWARQHHSLWAAEQIAGKSGSPTVDAIDPTLTDNSASHETLRETS
ncbi:MAG: formate dehydrogenase subunit gamma, partial [Rhizobiales bacterium]|nr:formate dehydrogenase subunit gamma [Hyphomicrobiales bacterium]